MRTFNYLFAIILACSTAVVLVGGYFLHKFQVKRNASAFLEQAQRDKTDVDKFRKESNKLAERRASESETQNLSWFINLVPEDPLALDATETLGMKFAEEFRDIRESAFGIACSQLEKVVMKDPERDKARRKLIDLWMMSGRFRDAGEHIEHFLEKNRNDPEMLTMLGRCQAATGEEKKAKPSFLAAIKNSAEQVDAYFYLALLLKENPKLCDRKEKLPGAEESEEDSAKRKATDNTPDAVLFRMIENNRASAKAHRYMCKYILSSKPDDAALKEALFHAKQSFDLEPEDRDSLSLVIHCSRIAGNLEDARKFAQEGLDKEKDSPERRANFYFELAQTELLSKNREGAMDVLRRGYKDLKVPLFLWFQADWQIDARDAEGAKKTIKELADLRFDNRGMEYLRGRVLFAENKWGQAVKALESSRGFNQISNNSDRLKLVEYWIGLCYGQLHNPDRQIESFKRSLKNDPDFEAAKVALAEAEGKVGRIALNPKEILKILRNTDSTMTVLKLFPLAIAANRQIPKEERNWESLEQLLRDLEEKFPDSAEISLLRYELMVAQERPDEELEKHLYALAEKYPKAFLSRRQLVGFLVGKKKYDEAEKQLAAFEETNGDTVDLRLAKASCYVQRYGKEAKDRLKSLEADTDAFDAREKNFLLTNLLNLMQAIDAQDEVQRLTEQLSGQGAGGLQVPSVRFEQAFKTSNVQEMEDAVRDLEKAENRGPISQYAKARLLLFKNSQNKDAALVDEALALLEKAKESRPNWPAVSFLMGFIYDQKGKPQQALEFYGETINQGNYNPTAIARTLMILAAQKRLPEALDLMNRLDREQAPITPAILKAWAEILWRQGEIDKALEKVRKFAAAAADSEDYRDFIFVGAVVDAAAQQAKANDPKKYDELLPEAEKAFRRAVELGKDAPEPWIALIQFLTTAEKVSEAEPVVEEAKKKISSKDAHLAFARIYEVHNKNDLAKEEYQAALAADSASSRVTRVVAEYAIRTNDVKQAEDLLTRIIDGKEVKSEKTDVMWARRTMALIIVRTRPGYENVEKARKLVERNLADDPKSTEDQSLWASFNSRDPKASNRLQAIQKLQELVDRKQASEKDMFTLSTLYLDNKDWRAASNVLRKLVVNSKDPQYMVFYILQLLEHNEEPDANLYLAQLRGKWPNHFQTVALEAELILRRGKPEEALDLVKGFVDRADAVPANRDQRIVLMMQVLEGLVIRVQKEEESDASKRFLETAERYLSSYVDGHPSAAMEFVKFLARRDRFEDAVAYLESNWTKCDEIAVAEASLAAADQGRGPKEVVDRTLNVLKDALQKFDNHPSLLLAIGDIHVGETKYDEAENCYREVLKNNPKLSTAMNNLVVMITLKPKNEKELNEALKMIDDAIRISGPVAQMLDTRACVYIALGQSDKALADMNDVVADRKTPDRLFHQAQALELAGKKNEAAIVMEEALGMGLSAKHLQKPELPAFERLKKLAKVESGGKKGK